MMLKFYSYYKQATVGACNIARPGFWDAVGRAKWLKKEIENAVKSQVSVFRSFQRDRRGETGIVD